MVEDKFFEPEDRVQKVGGSYQANGTVKARWKADDGSWRYVFRFDEPAGMLHIFNGEQLVSLIEAAWPEGLEK